MRESHCFEINLSLRRGFGGILMRIWIKRSWLLAMVSAEAMGEEEGLVFFMPAMPEIWGIRNFIRLPY